ncbi:MAG: site-specific integrase, partial [Ignavibacteria bacterium]|nr:site-specific integrase [Ignavibacteria bacterium]
MKVELKQRPLSNGLTSLYLEYYLGYDKINGKVKHKRKKENLELYIYSAPKNNIERTKNKELLETADKILTIKKSEIIQSKHTFLKSKSKVLLTDYFMQLADERKNSKANYGNWTSTYKHLVGYLSTKYNPDTFKLSDVDDDFLKGFKSYLDTELLTKSNSMLSENSKASYFLKFRACIREAFNNKLIDDNPFTRVKGFKGSEPQREYLTKEEMNKLGQTECRYPVLKRAFMFSCITGLRWSDIFKMKWSEIVDNENGSRIIFKQKKTKEQEYLDLNPQARELLGTKRASEERVFIGLRYSNYMNMELQRWVLKAGITKQVTFHCARHSFATYLITNDVDLYVIQKLLGHKNILTTQIYAKVIDQKKKDAVNKIPELN